MRWPGGLKLWRVTGGGVDLGDKEPYDPDEAPRARAGARGTLRRTARRHRDRRAPAARGRHRRAVRHRALRSLVVRGPRIPRRGLPLARARGARACGPSPAPRHLAEHPARAADRACPPAPGAPTGTSACGSASSTAWTWERLWPLEETLLGRGAGCADRAARRAPGAGAGRARAAAGPVVRLAVHHLDRCRGGLRRAALPAALRRRGGPARRTRFPAPKRASPRRRRPPRSCTAATTSSPISFPPSPRRSAAPDRWRSADMAPIRFVFGLHLHQPVGNFDHVFAQHVEDVYRPLLDRLAGRGFLPGRAASLGASARVARGSRARLPRPAGRARLRGQGRDAPRRLLRAGARRAAAGGSRRADPVDARSGAAALRGGRARAVAHRAGLGARARRRSRGRRRAIRAGGRPPLPRHRLPRRAAARPLLDRERRASGWRSFPSTSGSAT